MEHWNDDKGKHFTPRIRKQVLRVIVRVNDQILRGNFHITPDHRLKDELDNGDKYVAITEAEIRDAQDEHVLASSPVVLINKSQILWIYPSGEPEESMTLDSLT